MPYKLSGKSRGGLIFGCGEPETKISLAIFASDLVVLILPLSAACAIYITWP
jgi:hypothetical protein